MENIEQKSTDAECKEFKDLCTLILEAKDERQLSIAIDKTSTTTFSHLSSELKSILVESGVLDRIVHLIQNFLHPTSILRSGSELTRLVNLVSNAASNEDLEEAVHAAGGVRVATTLMEMGFQVPLCLTLIGNVIGNTSIECSVDTVQAIERGCSLIVEDHERFMNNVGYVINALMSRIDSLGGTSVECLLEKLDTFIDMLFQIIDRKVSNRSCRLAVAALVEIIADAKANEVLMARHELLDKIISLLDDDDMLEPVFMIVSQFAETKDEKHLSMLLESKNVAPMIKQMINDHPESVDPYFMITNLAMEDIAAKCWIIDNGLFPTQVHTNPRVMAEQLKILCHFCSANATSHSLFVANGGLKLMMELIQINDGDGDDNTDPRRNFAHPEVLAIAKACVAKCSEDDQLQQSSLADSPPSSPDSQLP